MEKLRKNAAGIDIGAKMIFIGVEGEQVKSFETFTEGFYQACDYLISKRIDTVAMEATGVYWIILYEIFGECWVECMACRWPSDKASSGS
jgi:transposase